MYHDEQMVYFHVLVYFDVIIFTNSEKQEELQVKAAYSVTMNIFEKKNSF